MMTPQTSPDKYTIHTKEACNFDLSATPFALIRKIIRINDISLSPHDLPIFYSISQAREWCKGVITKEMNSKEMNEELGHFFINQLNKF